MFEVLTSYTVEDELNIMGLRAELSYLIRSKNSNDTHVISSIISGEKTYITLIYLNITKNGEYLQEYANSYMGGRVLIYDHLEWNGNKHWIIDAINYIGGENGKYYVSNEDMLKPADEYEAPDIVEAYERLRSDLMPKIEGLWDGMWMKGLTSFYNKGWPVKPSNNDDDWYCVEQHLPRVMGDFYQFYSRRLRGITSLTFRIPYNFSIIHELCNRLPEHDLSINGGFLTVHNNLDKYEDILNLSRVVENALLVKYKTADYWGDNIDTIKPWSTEFNIQSIRINGYQCYLAQIPNVISVDDGRGMIAHMLQDNIKK